MWGCIFMSFQETVGTHKWIWSITKLKFFNNEFGRNQFIQFLCPLQYCFFIFLPLKGWSEWLHYNCLLSSSPSSFLRKFQQHSNSRSKVYTNNNLNYIFVILLYNQVIPEILFSQHNAPPEFSRHFFNTTFSMELNLHRNGSTQFPFLKYIQCLRLLCPLWIGKQFVYDWISSLYAHTLFNFTISDKKR